MRNDFSIALEDPITCAKLRYLEQKSCPRLRKYRLLLAMALGVGGKAGVGAKIGLVKLAMAYGAFSGLKKIQRMAHTPHLALYVDIALAALTLTLMAPEILTRVHAYKKRQTSDAIYADLENSVRSGKLEVRRAAKIKNIFAKIFNPQGGAQGGEPEGYYFWDDQVKTDHLIHPDGGLYLIDEDQKLMLLPAMKPTPYISRRRLERLATLTEVESQPKTLESFAQRHAVLNEALNYMTGRSGLVVWWLSATSFLNPKVRKYDKIIGNAVDSGELDVYVQNENGKKRYSMRDWHAQRSDGDDEENTGASKDVIRLTGRSTVFSSHRLRHLEKLNTQRLAYIYLNHAI